MFLVVVIPSGPASTVWKFPSSVVQPAYLRHACGAAVVHCSGNSQWGLERRLGRHTRDRSSVLFVFGWCWGST